MKNIIIIFFYTITVLSILPFWPQDLGGGVVFLYLGIHRRTTEIGTFYIMECNFPQTIISMGG
jgi:hypothetical protein